MPVSPPPPTVTCSVVSTPSGASTRFQGKLVSLEAVDGTYRFAIKKSGPAGTSMVQQGGRFSAPARTETFVASTTVSVEPGAEYDVDFSVEVAGNAYHCDRVSGGKT